MSVEIVGADKLVARTRGMSLRMLDMEPVLKHEARAFEESEKALFGSLGGQYVATGALRDSLTTSSASGAVRRTTHDQLKFGSDIYYAAFQVVDPGPQTGAGGLARKGHPSAVLKLDSAAGFEVVRNMGTFIMYGGA
jgi:hypothetical protein